MTPLHRLLTLLILAQPGRWTIADLAHATGASPRSIQRALTTLTTHHILAITPKKSGSIITPTPTTPTALTSLHPITRHLPAFGHHDHTIRHHDQSALPAFGHHDHTIRHHDAIATKPSRHHDHTIRHGDHTESSPLAADPAHHAPPPEPPSRHHDQSFGHRDATAARLSVVPSGHGDVSSGHNGTTSRQNDLSEGSGHVMVTQPVRRMKKKIYSSRILSQDEGVLRPGEVALTRDDVEGGIRGETTRALPPEQERERQAMSRWYRSLRPPPLRADVVQAAEVFRRFAALGLTADQVRAFWEPRYRRGGYAATPRAVYADLTRRLQEEHDVPDWSTVTGP